MVLTDEAASEVTLPTENRQTVVGTMKDPDKGEVNHHHHTGSEYEREEKEIQEEMEEDGREGKRYNGNNHQSLVPAQIQIYFKYENNPYKFILQAAIISSISSFCLASSSEGNKHELSSSFTQH